MLYFAKLTGEDVGVTLFK